MIRIPCALSDGLRESEVVAEVQDAEGRPERVSVPRDFIVERDGKPWLPLSAWFWDQTDDVIHARLPVESHTGAHQITLKTSQIIQEKPCPR